MVIAIHCKPKAKLPDVALAKCAFCFSLISAKRWEEQRGQDTNDGNNNQQFNQRKCRSLLRDICKTQTLIIRKIRSHTRETS